MNNPIYLALIILLLVSLTACSSNTRLDPQFYPNSKYKEVGSVRAQQDLQYCRSVADEYVKQPQKWKELTKKTAKSSVIGAGAGAVGGAIVHNAGRGTAIGAASSAVVTLLSELFKAGEPDPTYTRFVEKCLDDKGYSIIAWN